MTVKIASVLDAHSTHNADKPPPDVHNNNQQVLLRNAKMATTVEHVKQLRDDITISTQQSIHETFRDSDKIAGDRAARLETRMNSLETHLARISAMLEGSGGTYPPPGAGLPGSVAVAGSGSGSGSGGNRSSGGVGGGGMAGGRVGSTQGVNGLFPMQQSRSVNSHLGSSSNQ